MQPAARNTYLRSLASPKLTVAFFILMAAGALWTTEGGDATIATLVPLTLLVLNLAAAIVTTPRFRADLPLLVFHLALLAFVALLAAARLIFFDGATIVTSGTAYEGNLVMDRRGPLHGNGVQSLRFANEGFTEQFPERGKYHATYNRIRWWDADGNTGVAEIGDDHPLMLDGYRIYTTARRGFSPLFLWQAADGETGFGTVQLPDHARSEQVPPVDWKLPGGGDATVMLDTGAAPERAQADRRSELGANEIPHRIILRTGERRLVLRPGDTIDVDGGKLSYVRLSSWMGYRIVYDPTEPWLVATVLIGVVTLLWFYAGLFWSPLRRNLAARLLRKKKTFEVTQ